MGLFTKEMAQKLVAGTAVTGMVAFGAISWTGTADLEKIKEKFDYVKDNYSNALVSLQNYRTVLAQKVQDIRGYESIQDELNAQITELKRQLADLEASGTDKDQTEINRLQGRVEELEGQLATAATEEQYNDIVKECQRLQQQLAKANSEVATLREYVVTNSDLAPTEVETVDSILAGNSTRNPLLTFELNGGDWSSVPTAKQNKITTFLNNLNILDTFHESPILLHLNSFNGDSYISVYTNSKEAVDRLSAVDGFVEGQGFYTIDGQIATQDEFFASSSNGKLQISINYASDEDWTGSLGHATVDHK